MFHSKALSLTLALTALCPVVANASSTLKPTSTALNLGYAVKGGNGNLGNLDNNAFRIAQAPYFGTLHRLVRTTSAFTSPLLHPASISVDLVARTVTLGAFRVRVFLADRTNGVNTFGPLNEVVRDAVIKPGYTHYKGLATGKIDRHVGLDGSMAVRVEVEQVGFAAVFTNMFDFDQLTVTVAQ